MKTYNHEEIQQLGDKVTSVVMKYFDEPDCNWKVVDKTPYVVIKSRRSTEFRGHLYRADGRLDVSVDKVYDMMSPESYMDGSVLEWDSSIKRTELIEQISDNLLIMRSITYSHLAGMISARDFVDVIHSTRTPTAMFNSAISIDHPLSDAHVRGKNHPIGVICSSIAGEPNKCMLTRFLQTNPGGQLPQALADSVVPSFLSHFYTNINRKLVIELAKLANEGSSNSSTSSTSSSSSSSSSWWW